MQVPDIETRTRERIAAVRRQRGLTQAELADRIGATATFISRLETGTSDLRLKLHTLAALAEALDVPLSELLSQPKDGHSDDEVRLIAAFSRLSPQDAALLISLAETLAAQAAQAPIAQALASLSEADRERVLVMSRALADRRPRPSTDPET